VPAGIDLAPFFSWLLAEIKSQHESEAMSLSVAAAFISTPDPVTGLPAPTPIPLSRLLLGVSQAVANLYPEGVWTTVEVVNVRAVNGHHYLEVSERDSSGKVLAKSSAVIWAKEAGRILPAFQTATGAKIGPGIKLLVRVRPVFKAEYGFHLMIDAIDAIDADYTLGDLEARKQEIRERLQREDLDQPLPTKKTGFLHPKVKALSVSNLR